MLGYRQCRFTLTTVIDAAYGANVRGVDGEVDREVSDPQVRKRQRAAIRRNPGSPRVGLVFLVFTGTLSTCRRPSSPSC